MFFYDYIPYIHWDWALIWYVYKQTNCRNWLPCDSKSWLVFVWRNNSWVFLLIKIIGHCVINHLEICKKNFLKHFIWVFWSQGLLATKTFEQKILCWSVRVKEANKMYNFIDCISLLYLTSFNLIHRFQNQCTSFYMREILVLNGLIHFVHPHFLNCSQNKTCQISWYFFKSAYEKKITI